MIKCFHDYSTGEELAAFMLHSSMKDGMKGLENSTLGNTVFHEVRSH